MGQSNCDRGAAALTIFFLALPPALAMDRVAVERVAIDPAIDPVAIDPAASDTVVDRVGVDRVAAGPATSSDIARGRAPTSNADAVLVARPCPTRFDYVVLASFADAPGLLSLSSYHFRSEVGFSTIPLTGLLRVDYRVEARAEACGARSTPSRRTN
jgi:hypothetical protein